SVYLTGSPCGDLATSVKSYPSEYGTRIDLGNETTAARGVEAVALELDSDRWPHPADQRQKAALDELKRGRGHVMRSSLDHQPALSRRCHQGWKHRLENQRTAARRADDEVVVASAYLTGSEGERLRS